MTTSEEEQIELAVEELLRANPFPESEWDKKLRATLTPTPGYERSYTEIQAELEAAGREVPPAVRLLAAWEQEGDDVLGPPRPRLNG